LYLVHQPFLSFSVACTLRAKSSNRKFIEELTKWTFQEKGVLDVVAVEHHKVGEEVAPAHYRIKDNMVRIFAVPSAQGCFFLFDSYINHTIMLL